MRYGFLLSWLLAVPFLLTAQEIFPLYSGPVPCATGRPATAYRDTAIGEVKTFVDTPFLVYHAPIPRMARRGAVIVVPGGGYWISAWDYEGTDPARRLAAEGYHAFVLAYRLPGRLPVGACRGRVALEDGQRAVQLVRRLADSLGYATDQVTMMGYSAGGHLAGSVAVHPRAGRKGASDPVARFDSRPDRSVLVYPVTIMNEEGSGHAGSQRALLGPEPTATEFDFYNLPARVDSLSPPTLLIHASDDRGVPVANSLRYYEALVRHGVPADLRVYATGGHGFGSARHLAGRGVGGWFGAVLEWLGGEGP